MSSSHKNLFLFTCYAYGITNSVSLFRRSPKKRIELLCTGKHRIWSPKHRFVRNIPETFKGLGLSQQPTFCPQKALLAGMNYLSCQTANTLPVSLSTKMFATPPIILDLNVP